MSSSSNKNDVNIEWSGVLEAAQKAEQQFPPHNEMSLGGQAVEGTLEIQVFRGDGTVEDHGIVTYYHKNPWKQAKWESENFGKLMPETEERIRQSVKDNALKVAGAVAAVGTLAYLVFRNK